jgi:hypothetical protein
LQPKYLFQEVESTLNRLVGNPCSSQISISMLVLLS